MKEYIEEIGQNIKDIRSAIENQGVDIPEDTPLDEYADKIAEIERPTVKIGHDILPFYCYADNEVDASNKSEPTIEWNSEKATWDITEYEDGWTQSIPSDNPNKLLYAMFVPIKEGQNSSDDTFAWPKAIRLQGKKGEKGEEGNDGRDGVIAGMIQYLAAHLFKIVLRDEVADELTKPVLTYDYRQISNEANRHPKPDFLQIKNTNGEFENIPEKSTSSNNTWGLNYELPSENPENYAVLKCVANYNSLSEDVVVTDPIMLSGEGVDGWIEHYCITNNNTLPGEDATWTSNEIPEEFYNAGKHYLWNKTEITYDSGRTVITSPVMIMSSPNAVNTIECLYGRSANISTEPEPDDWTENIPDDFIVLWKKETTTFTIGDPKVTITPIAVKGNPGVDILAQVEEEEVNQWTYEYMSSLDRNEYYLKKGIIVGKDLYIWNGSKKPEWTINFWLTEDDYYWIIIQDAFATKVQADWNEDDDTMHGYIKNRPIISNNWSVEVPADNLYFIDKYIYLPTFPYVKVNEIEFKVGGLSCKLTKDNNSCTMGETTYTWEDSIITTSQRVTVEDSVTMSGIQTRLSQKYVDNIIDLGDKALLKILWLKNSSKLIPGSTYKFTYKNVEYLVNAIDSTTLSETCVSKYHTIVVNWDFYMYKALNKNYASRDVTVSVCGRWIKGSWQYGNVRKEEYYEVETNCFLYYIPNGSPTDILLDVDELDVRGYKDHRGNEWNALYSAEAEMLQEFSISFEDNCYGNKVNVYVTDPHIYQDITVKITSNSHNNIISCYNESYIECVSSFGNTISVVNNSYNVYIEDSNLNNITIKYDNELTCFRSDCNTVYIFGASSKDNWVKLSETQCNLIKLYYPKSRVLVDEDYASCVILNESVFSDSGGYAGTVFASKVVTL